MLYFLFESLYFPCIVAVYVGCSLAVVHFFLLRFYMSIPQFISIPLDGLLSCFSSLTNTNNVDMIIDI